MEQAFAKHTQQEFPPEFVFFIEEKSPEDDTEIVFSYTETKNVSLLADRYVVTGTFYETDAGEVPVLRAI